jgi:hypothetical protein
MIPYKIDREHRCVMPAPAADHLTRRRVVDYGRLAAAL